MAQARTLAEIINELFKTFKAEDRSEYSNAEIARSCEKWLKETYGGGTFSREYMRQLRNGTATNPKYRQLEALAAVFDTDMAVFLDPVKSEAIMKDYEFARAAREEGVEAIVLRAVGFSPEERQKIFDFMNHLKSIR